MKIPTLKNVYSQEATEAVSHDYPYGRLRCTAKWWIESNGKKGMRVGFQTINPKTGRVNAPKYSTYEEFKVLFIDPENGHIKSDGLYGARGSEDAQKFLDKYDHADLTREQLELFIVKAKKIEEYFHQHPITFAVRKIA